MANKEDFVDLGVYCADICTALERGVDGKELDKLSDSMREAIEELERWVEPAVHISRSSTHHDLDRRIVAEIHEKVKKRSGRNSVSRFFHSSDDKDAIAAWKGDLARLLQVFNVCSAHSCLALANDSVSDPVDCEH